MIKSNHLKTLLCAFAFIFCFFQNSFAQSEPRKRDFRGAWIQCVNGQFQGMSVDAMQKELLRQLTQLQKDGVNAIIFQVRPECDALYKSNYEPWSRFLTGVQGKSPIPSWDPLRWMIKQCHDRGMELHAWINPFRAKTKNTTSLSNTHIAIRHPERVFSYDGQFILNPALQENREYICKVVNDIVRRYDVDGIHMDDYFYPYPVPGLPIPDGQYFQKYNNGIKNIGDWRRYNVNLFVKQLSDSIHAVKPWVKFGISPFGIYRNKKNAPEIGSNTNGLQNYDDLYADVILWINNGWIDYCAPQLYWQIGHKTADYKELISWWNRYAANRPLFIGEDVERTVKYPDVANSALNQMPAKYALHEQMENVQGTVLWYSKAVVDNMGNYGKVLQYDYWRYPSLQPRMPFIDSKSPKKPRKVAAVWTSDGQFLFWQQPKWKNWKDEVIQYVIYRFSAKDKIDINNPANIVGITRDTKFKLPFISGKDKYLYVITSLDRMSNESKGKKVKVKL